MQAQKEQIGQAALLSAVYKNAKMGADAIIRLLPRVGTDALRSAMTMQLDGYEKYAFCAKSALEELGEEAKEENLFTRWMAQVGMTIQTIRDDSESRLAQMMIEGLNMGVTELVRLLNNCEVQQGATQAVCLARELLLFEQQRLEILKRFL